MFSDIVPALPSSELSSLRERIDELEKRIAQTDQKENNASKTIRRDPLQQAKAKEAWIKLDGCALEARALGIKYIWIDTCCIDQSSSTELSESINSMFAWYRDCKVCFAYLSDTPASAEPQKQVDKAMGSKWFDRGWTLQELLAPREVLFYNKDWGYVGQKSTLADRISQRTGINADVLRDGSVKKIKNFSVAQRLSWAARRITTRVEDRAYSLLGLFDVFMPVIYGEGAENAFLRLQKEIFEETQDQSLFAWVDPYTESTSLSVQTKSVMLPLDPDKPSGLKYRRNLYRCKPDDVTNIFASSADFFRSSAFILDARAQLESELSSWRIPKLELPDTVHLFGVSVPLLLEQIEVRDDGAKVYLAYLSCVYRRRHTVPAIYLISRIPGKYVRLSPKELLSFSSSDVMSKASALRLGQVYPEKIQRGLTVRPRVVPYQSISSEAFSFIIKTGGMRDADFEMRGHFPPLWKSVSLETFCFEMATEQLKDMPLALRIDNGSEGFLVLLHIEMNPMFVPVQSQSRFLASIYELPPSNNSMIERLTTDGSLETLRHQAVHYNSPKVDLCDGIIVSSLRSGKTVILSLNQETSLGELCLHFTLK